METKLKRPLEGADLSSPVKKIKKETNVMAEWNQLPTEVPKSILIDSCFRKLYNLPLFYFDSFLLKYLRS